MPFASEQEYFISLPPQEEEGGITFNIELFFDRVRRLNDNKIRIKEDWLEKDIKILVIGAGGIGYYAVQQLLRTIRNIRSLTIIDDDVLKNENLNRIGFIDQLGQRKIEIIREIIERIRPDIVDNVRLVDTKVEENNIQQFIEDVDIVIDETDILGLLDLLLKYRTEYNYGVLSIKYDGFSKGTLYHNSKPLVYDDLATAYQIIPSLSSSAMLFSSILMMYMLSHDITYLKKERKTINIDLEQLMSFLFK